MPVREQTIVQSESFESVIEHYRNEQTQFMLQQFMRQVKDFFELNPVLHRQPFPVIHSVKARTKDPEHLRDKLIRKKNKGISIDAENLFAEVTDLAGVRVLHLYQDQFEMIHKEIMEKVAMGDWILREDPKAYTWDPETKEYFEQRGIKTEIKESYYTSVHYLIRPNNTNPMCCEIQVRTLFEEIWGEIDHAINYPHKTESIACAEQIRVLSKLVSTGTRLSDAIFRSHGEYIEKKVHPN